MLTGEGRLRLTSPFFLPNFNRLQENGVYQSVSDSVLDTLIEETGEWQPCHHVTCHAHCCTYSPFVHTPSVIDEKQDFFFRSLISFFPFTDEIQSYCKDMQLSDLNNGTE